MTTLEIIFFVLLFLGLLEAHNLFKKQEAEIDELREEINEVKHSANEKGDGPKYYSDEETE